MSAPKHKPSQAPAAAPQPAAGKPKSLSGRALARECGAVPDTANRWLKDAGCDTLNLDPDRHDEYVGIIRERQAGAAEKVERLTSSDLMRECGSDRESVNKWLIQEGHDPRHLDPAKHDLYVEIIQRHQNSSKAPGMPGAMKGTDGDGLTWLEAVQREDAIRKKRENMIAAKVLAEEWISASAHHQILSSLTSRLETVPDKIRTELGLTIAQRDRIQKILDETRFDAAEETRRAMDQARKKVEETKI